MLPADIGSLAAIALIGASVLGSFISASAGLGGGVLLLSVMAALMPPAALIPIHGVVQIGSNVGRVLMLRQHIRTDTLAAFAAGSLIGAVGGGFIAVQVPPELLRLGIGLFILYSVWGPPPPAIGGKAVLVSGVVSSFLTMFFGATGPFVAAVWRQLYTERLSFVAVHAVSMTLQHGIKILVFGLLGFAYAPYIPLIAAMMVAGLVGTWAGKRLLLRLTDRSFGLALKIILTLLAIRLVWIGASALV